MVRAVFVFVVFEREINTQTNKKRIKWRHDVWPERNVSSDGTMCLGYVDAARDGNFEPSENW